MVRAPCCEKTGLKKGPWTPQEDQILTSYIQQHGHNNWRALPKQAGLLRCGKSCRLRWTNYLRPDIKRGNFSKEEEETIINWHEMLGNRCVSIWSAIAARLPGRTDNEIKNVWHTYLKKRPKNYHTTSNNKEQSLTVPKFDSNASIESKSMKFHIPTHPRNESPGYAPSSPQQSSSELSSVTDLAGLPNNMVIKNESETFPQVDESFWSKKLSAEKSNMKSDFPSNGDELQFLVSSIPAATTTNSTMEHGNNKCSFNIDDDMDFWYNLLIRTGGHLPELPEF
ncbi:hypothetical protein CsSME_00020628 [Camellia sinensis var. sinensis]